MHIDQAMMTEEELARHRKPKRQVRPTDVPSQMNCAKKATGQAIPPSSLQLVAFAESAACASAVPSQSAPVPLKPSSFYPSTMHLDAKPSTTNQLKIEQDDEILMEGIHDVWHGNNDTEKDDDGSAVSLYSASELEDDDDDDDDSL